MNVLDQISQLEGMLAYVQSVLNTGGMEVWEVKEYMNMASDYEKQIAAMKIYVSENLEVFN